MKLQLAIIISICIFCRVTTAIESGVYSYGPVTFSNNNTVTYPRFSPTLGYLHSITFVLTNCILQNDIICDNDSTDDLILDTRVSEPLHLYKDGQSPIDGFYGFFGHANTNITGVFGAMDDGDRATPHTQNGGPDELTFTCAYSNLAGSFVMTRANILSDHSTKGSNSVHIETPFFGYTVGDQHVFEVFRTNEIYRGELYVFYNYEDRPLAPKVTSFASSDATSYLDIQDISVGSSNKLQRSFDILSTNWTDVTTFNGVDWQTNLTININSEWTSVFYRVLSK